MEIFTFSVFHDATLLGSFTTPPTDNTSATGTSLFLGAKETGSDRITRVTISSLSTDPVSSNDFAIGAVTLSAPAAVPEPGSIALMMGTAFGGLLLHRRWKQVSVTRKDTPCL